MDFPIQKENKCGKELLLATLRREEHEGIPWVPFSGVHAGKLKGYNATEVLTNPDKLKESLLEVHKLYRPDGLPVVFDLQIEAEILGCELLWDEKAPPSVKNHPLAAEKIIPEKLPEPSDGRFPIILDVMRFIKENIGDSTALFGLICGPLTLASHLRGTDFFMDMIEEPEYTRELLAYTSSVVKKVTDFYLEAGMDVIGIVDPLVSQISPRHFKKLLLADYKDIFAYIKSHDALSSFFVCGDATRNIRPMCETGPDSIFVDENINMLTAKEITDEYDIILGGNIPLTTTMLYGSQQDNMKYVVDLLDELTHKNLVIAPGCDMPYDIPPENTVAVQEAIKETDTVRKILENYTKVDSLPEVELPDYENIEKPLIEVFTIDSATCAACTYMYGAAVDAKNHYGDKINVVEYKSTELEGIARARKLGIKNLPCIFINGELKFSSIIPNREELFEEIEKRLTT